MLPVLVLQNLTSDGPAYLGTWLREHGIPVDVRNSQQGDAYPERIDGYRALALLGGEMSANDPLPSLRQAESLFLQAHHAGLPVVGHCLGGQLMAKALGARITASPAPEIGWQQMVVNETPEARAWLGEGAEHTVMHWHGEAFELPAGATPLATSSACPVQAFSYGRHLAMQFHVEVDEEKLMRWSASVDPAYLRAQGEFPATVHSGSRMRADAKRCLPLQQALARRIYERWMAAAPEG
ncbi:type 1 glutamine amidotransferase [Aquincola sp. MAHUQ-54]|uniref:Type 1 glutamine amidotransferase n=1 Tax=Aquincola agrisoli TaxID=3119538 RepID=A0AAW9QJL8_9BURK